MNVYEVYELRIEKAFMKVKEGALRCMEVINVGNLRCMKVNEGSKRQTITTRKIK